TASGALGARAELIEHVRQLRRQRRAQAELPALRPCEAQAVRVQEHAPETERAQLLVEGGVAVLVVSRNRVRGVLCVYADLMSAARAQPDLHEGRRPAEELDRPELAHRGLSRGRRTHRALTADPRIGAQRNIDALGSELPLASDEREVALLDPALTHERVETAQCGRVACDEQAPAR